MGNPSTVTIVACLAVVSAGSVACAPPVREEEAPLPACPGDGWIDGRVPMFPGLVITSSRGTTRGRMDVDAYTGEIPAPFSRVRAFYVQCLGSEAAGEDRANLFRLVGDTRWRPGEGPLVPESPQGMADKLTLWDLKNGTTKVSISIAIPEGRGRSADPRK